MRRYLKIYFDDGKLIDYTYRVPPSSGQLHSLIQSVRALSIQMAWRMHKEPTLYSRGSIRTFSCKWSRNAAKYMISGKLPYLLSPFHKAFVMASTLKIMWPIAISVPICRVSFVSPNRLADLKTLRAISPKTTHRWWGSRGCPKDPIRWKTNCKNDPSPSQTWRKWCIKISRAWRLRSRATAGACVLNAWLFDHESTGWDSNEPFFRWIFQITENPDKIKVSFTPLSLLFKRVSKCTHQALGSPL